MSVATAEKQLVIVGLGNLPLPRTRHSVGNLIIDALAARWGVRLSTNRSMGGTYGKVDALIGDEMLSVTLLKPQPLMNISGPSVSQCLKQSKATTASLILIHDSLSNPSLKVSPKQGGSANGHNGVKSTISAVGTQNFHRLRIGIGGHQGDAASYVLGKLSRQELKWWSEGGDGIELVVDAIEKFAKTMKV